MVTLKKPDSTTGILNSVGLDESSSPGAKEAFLSGDLATPFYLQKGRATLTIFRAARKQHRASWRWILSERSLALQRPRLPSHAVQLYPLRYQR